MDKLNIFNFAKKELSQDAFLLWLFSNYASDKEDIADTSKKIIKKMTNMTIEEINSITNVTVKAQENKIDIIVIIETLTKNHIIAIEDKTTSIEHSDQLTKYRDYIFKNYPGYQTHFIFYKTNLMTTKEIYSVASKGFVVYDIYAIYYFYKDIYADSYLLKAYIDYINELYSDLTQDLPEQIKDWNLFHWKNYATKLILDLPQSIQYSHENYHNQYYCLRYTMKHENKPYPYLEIRSRDVKDGQFIIKVLVYNIDKDIVNRSLAEWKNQINDTFLFHSQNHPKQIGINRFDDDFHTIEEFNDFIKKYVLEYYKTLFN